MNTKKSKIVSSRKDFNYSDACLLAVVIKYHCSTEFYLRYKNGSFKQLFRALVAVSGFTLSTLVHSL